MQRSEGNDGHPMVEPAPRVADPRLTILNIVIIASGVLVSMWATSGGTERLSWVKAFGLANTLLVVYGVLRNRLLNVDTDSAYGRYSAARQGDSVWVKPIDAHIAWIVMEAPSMIVPLLFLRFASKDQLSFVSNLLPVYLFLLHYMLRTFVMGFLTRGGKEMPLSIMIQGAIFCSINGFTQAYFHMFEVNPSTPVSWLSALVKFFGLILFFVGMGINHHCDSILRNLRKSPEDKGYYIPYGGLFTMYSAPNLIGEIIEWWGFALFCQTAIAVGFAASTTAIIGNRAYGHHQWYLRKFKEEYAKLNRWSLIPGVI